MALTINPQDLWTIAPHANEIYRRAFRNVNTFLFPFGILDNERRMTHFLAQVLHETGGLRQTVENLNYRVDNLMRVWPARFPSYEDALPYAFNPQALANKVYGGRMGNTAPNDGWTYYGRGLLQITGRANYRRVGQFLGIALEQDPELALHPDWCLQVAGAIWKLSDGNSYADTNDLKKVTKAINGGYHGLVERGEWLKKVRQLYGITDTRHA